MGLKGSENKSRHGFTIVFFTVILTLLISGTVAYLAGFLGPGQGRKPSRPAEPMEKAAGYEGNAAPSGERKILYWRAPMNPKEIYDKPGKSAMGMDLVPVYEDAMGGGATVKIDPVTQQNMGVRTAVVKKGPLVYGIRTFGHITPDETRTVQVTPKTSGWIEKLYVNFTGIFVEKGEPIYEIYSPELVAAQEEYLVTYRNLDRLSNKSDRGLIRSAHRRLRYFDVPESEILGIEKSGMVKKTLKILSPFSGFVIEKNVEEGGFVKTGTRVFRIADLTHIWVEAHIYEYELPWVKEGQSAEMTLSYLPGKFFSGKVTYVYPYIQPKTRDVVIRLEFENPDLELKPDMYADVLIKSVSEEEGLIIPSEAVIRSGVRNIVFMTRDRGKFIPRDVILGRSLEDRRIEIVAGLSEGDSVVISGQFLLDSEAKLKEAVQKMLDAKEREGDEGDFFTDMEG